MFLRRLKMSNYGVFRNAEFNLVTSPDKPLILITANNGGGKTSTLAAFRLALHGRRAFDVPLGEREYFETIKSRFHNGDTTRPCSIELDFEFVDNHTTRMVKISRQWAMRRKRIAEELSVAVDGKLLPPEDADDLLVSAVPPEVARYFFFDGERIRELADWDDDEELALFDAVSDLLGVQLIDQLIADLERIKDSDRRTSAEYRDFSQHLPEARNRAQRAIEEHRKERARGRKVKSAYDRARSALRRLGMLYADELNDVRNQLAACNAEYTYLLEEASRAAHDILPLLCGRRLRRELGSELERRRQIEEGEIIQRFFEEHADKLRQALKEKEFSPKEQRRIFEALEKAIRTRPVPVGHALPNISRAEAAWMQRVVERELPELEARMRVTTERMKTLEREIQNAEARLQQTPQGDPKGESALRELEQSQRDLVEHETRMAALEHERTEAITSLESLEKQARLQRLAAFQARRLIVRETLVSKIAEALPALASRLQSSKEKRFAEYLLASLTTLWHKKNRLTKVDVSFSERSIELYGSRGVIQKKDLSSGEKQLFASAFIYSLARLSGRHMPFVIDTPLGRLDHEHRRRFVSSFLPDASHQTVLLSTDTEIVGRLYSDIKSLIAHRYELADYNGAITVPVQLALAT